MQEVTGCCYCSIFFCRTCIFSCLWMTGWVVWIALCPLCIDRMQSWAIVFQLHRFFYGVLRWAARLYILSNSLTGYTVPLMFPPVILFYFLKGNLLLQGDCSSVVYVCRFT
jgi:hypothetical protein